MPSRHSRSSILVRYYYDKFFPREFCKYSFSVPILMLCWAHKQSLMHGYLNFSYSTSKYLVDFKGCSFQHSEPAAHRLSRRLVLALDVFGTRDLHPPRQHPASFSSEARLWDQPCQFLETQVQSPTVTTACMFCHLLLHIFWSCVVKSVDSIFPSFWWISSSLGHLGLSSKLFPFRLLYISVSYSAHSLITKQLYQARYYLWLCLNCTHHRGLKAAYF